MPNNVPGQIISELGEIGKKVGGEVAKAPKDIAGRAMESLGATSGTKIGGTTTATPGGEGAGGTASAWTRIDTESDQKARRAMARRALEEFRSGSIKRTREPSIWEKLQTEADQKKEQSDQQQAASAASQLVVPAGKPKAGFGIAAKKTAAENKNVRQD